VADGDSRAWSALEPAIRVKVTAAYASQLSEASFLKRLWLSLKIRREIARRIHQQAPPDALY
jgi:hypothetical protein